MTQPVIAENPMLATLEQAASRPDSGRLGLWAWLVGALDFASYRPNAALSIVISALADRDGPYYILKNPDTHTYYRLSERDHYLWGLMDGSRSVKDLVVAYFMQYGSFAFNRVAVLVSALRANGFFVDRPVNVYSAVGSELARRDPRARAARMWQGFMQTPFAISGIDGFFEQVYRRGGRLLFTKPMLLLYVLLSLAGVVLFGRLFMSGKYGVVTANGSVALGAVLLLVAQFLSIFVHELAHALTVKHYGREVRKAGMLLYMGMPAFFVDTTDIWLARRRARLAVTWAGPYSGLVLGSLACIALTIWPNSALGALWFKFAFMCYLLVFLNLNPLLELDGYYLLMDWLGIPMLRRRSMSFVTEGLPAKWRNALAGRDVAGKVPAGTLLRARFAAITKLTREERIFAAFGVLALVWTAYAIYAGLSFWQSRLAGNISDLWTGAARGSRLFLALLGLLISVVFVAAAAILPYRLARSAMLGLSRRGAFATTGRAALLSTAAIILVGAFIILARQASLWLPLGIASLIVAVTVAILNARAYAGSHLAVFFALLAASMAAFLASTLLQAVYLFAPWALAPSDAWLVLALAGFVVLLAAALVEATSTLRAFRFLRSAEKAGVVVGLAASVGLAAWTFLSQEGVATSWPALALLVARLSCVLTVILLAPTIASFWSTMFGPAWAVIGGGAAALLILPLVGLPLSPASTLLAAGLWVHRLAYTRFTKRPVPVLVSRSADAHEHLRDVFTVLAGSIGEQLGQTAGLHQAEARLAAFNKTAEAAGWKVTVLSQGVADNGPRDETLVDQGRRYAIALNFLVDNVAQASGEKLAFNSLQRAYDRLPWEQREPAAHYLFPDMRRAEVLSRQFESLQKNSRLLIKRMPLFATMSESELDLLASQLQIQKTRAGQVIIRQGDPGDKFYIISYGQVEVSVRRDNGVVDVVAQLGRGMYFGEMALLTDAPRNATCRAAVPVELLVLERANFDNLVRNRFELRGKVDEAVRRVELLRNIPLFAEADASQLQDLAAALHEECFEPGEALMREGESGDKFYIIESGRVRVTSGADGSASQRVLAEPGPGEYLGEIALLMKVPRTATVRAILATRTQVLHAADFDRLVARSMYGQNSITQEATRRLAGARRLQES